MLIINRISPEITRVVSRQKVLRWEKGGSAFLGLWLWCLVPLNHINNISVILWRSVLLVEETIVPGENHDLPHIVTGIMLYRIQLAMSGIPTCEVIGSVCPGSCKSNYHTTTMAPVTFHRIFN
jgi:hypothetical protein